jgi:hypothetical protein
VPSYRELVSNDYCALSIDDARGIVRFVRTAVAVRSTAEADLYFGEVNARLDSLGRTRMKLILDFRDAPMRNDPAFEATMAEHRKRLVRDVARVAIIVKTAVGRLHVQRLGKEDHIDQAIVATEEAAIEYVTQKFI